MDLMHLYCKEVLGLPDLRVLAASFAKDVYLNFSTVYGHEKFDKFDNTPTGVPNKGDILFWGTGVGPYGHVAIYVSGDVMNIKSFDQNYPTGSSCHLQDHNYKGVLGWLRLKQPVDPYQSTVDQVRQVCDSPTSAVNKVNQIKYLVSKV